MSIPNAVKVNICEFIINQAACGPRFNTEDMGDSRITTFHQFFEAVDDYRQDYMELCDEHLPWEEEMDRESWDEAVKRLLDLEMHDLRPTQNFVEIERANTVL